MIYHTITSYADPNITQEVAAQRLPSDKVVVGWYSNREVRQSVVHFHPYHEFILMVSGKATYLANGSRYILRPGELMLIPPGMAHSGYYDTYDRLILQIDDPFWLDTLGRYHIFFQDRVPQFMIFQAEACFHWGIRGVIERFAAAAAIPTPERKDLMYRCLLAELTMIIWQIIDEKRTAKPSATNTLVAKTTAYLQEHFRDPECSVSRLAQNAYVSREHLSRVFKEYTMESIYSYLTNLRMQGCRRAIAAGDSVLDACTENGFSNYSSFLRSFRKLYGITPTEYRAQLKKAMQQ